MEEYVRKELFEGAQLIHVPTGRFKTTRITLRFAVDLKEDTVASFAAVPGLIRYTSAKYPTNMLTERKLASLYGASFSAVSGKIGDMQVLSFTMSAVADRFAFEGESVSRECLQFLLEALLHPDLDENGLFKEENLAREKRLMEEAIKEERNDKMAYSLARFNEVFLESEGAALSPNGTLEQVEQLSVEEVTLAWKTMLKSAKIMAFTLGVIPIDSVEEAIKGAFAGVQRAYTEPKTTAHPAAKRIKEENEVQPLEQCKLNLGFSYESENEGAAKLFNKIFGGYFLSKLSKVVREKMSLCYFCSSTVGLHKRVIIVYSGVQSENKKKATQAILEQLKAIQNGEISDSELELARKSLKEGYLSLDTPLDISRWYLSQMAFDTLQTPLEAWKEVERVQKEEVVAFAKTVRLDTIYTLGAEQNEEN